MLFDAAGAVVDKASREHRQIYPQPGWVEHDAEEIWQNVLAVVGEVAGPQRDKTCGRRRSGDHQSARNDRRLRSQDRPAARTTRSSGNAAAATRSAANWRAPATSASSGSKTGLKLDTYFSGSKLKWLIRERPEIRRQLDSGDALVGTIDTYLIYRLTGGEVFATDPTNASRTLLFDIGRLRWDEELVPAVRRADAGARRSARKLRPLRRN